MTITGIMLIIDSVLLILILYAATFDLRYKRWKQRLDKLIDEIRSGADLRPLNRSELCALNKFASNELNDLNILIEIYAAKSLIIDKNLHKKLCRLIPEYEDKIILYKKLFYQSEKDSHARSILSQLEQYAKEQTNANPSE